MKSPRVLVTTIAAALFACAASTTHAALLVYEPFAGYTVGDINAQTANGNTIGMSGNYAASGAYDFTLSGLTFSNLTTSGGALTVTATAGTTGGGPITLGAPFSGTLYSSYLVNLTNDPAGDTATMRINDSGTAGVATARFRADAQSGGATDVIAVGYDENVTEGTGNISSGSTFLMLGRFTNVNTTLTVGTPGVATAFALSVAQFNFFNVDGSITDAELDGAAVGAGANQVTGKATTTMTTENQAFATGNAFQFATANTGGGITLRYDEVRFGQSFVDVTPVPEPGSAVLLGMGMLGLLGARRRRG